MVRIKSVLLLLGLLLAPAALSGQKAETQYGKCGKTSWSPDEVRILFGDLFMQEDQEELRNLWGIRRVSDRAAVYAVSDERKCRALMRPLRDGFRQFDDGTRLSDYVLSFLRIGDYYVIVLDYPEGTVPAGYSGRIPVYIVDGTTMTYVTRILS